MKPLLIAGLLLLPFMDTVAETDAGKKAGNSADSVEVTLQSTITGNREQPKVLYIVPWQAPAGPEPLREGFQNDLSELFQPIERDEFLRQLKHKTATLKQPIAENK